MHDAQVRSIQIYIYIFVYICIIFTPATWKSCSFKFRSVYLFTRVYLFTHFFPSIWPLLCHGQWSIYCRCCSTILAPRAGYGWNWPSKRSNASVAPWKIFKRTWRGTLQGLWQQRRYCRIVHCFLADSNGDVWELLSHCTYYLSPPWSCSGISLATGELNLVCSSFAGSSLIFPCVIEKFWEERSFLSSYLQSLCFYVSLRKCVFFWGCNHITYL